MPKKFRDGELVEITGAELVDYEYRRDNPEPPHSSKVDREQARRLKTFTFEGNPYQLNETRIGLMAADARHFVQQGGDPNDTSWIGVLFTWTDENNVEQPMSPATLEAFAIAARTHVYSHQKAARAIKNLSPIPQDYADDSRWP